MNSYMDIWIDFLCGLSYTHPSSIERTPVCIGAQMCIHCPKIMRISEKSFFFSEIPLARVCALCISILVHLVPSPRLVSLHTEPTNYRATNFIKLLQGVAPEDPPCQFITQLSRKLPHPDHLLRYFGDIKKYLLTRKKKRRLSPSYVKYK